MLAFLIGAFAGSLVTLVILSIVIVGGGKK